MACWVEGAAVPASGHWNSALTYPAFDCAMGQIQIPRHVFYDGLYRFSRCAFNPQKPQKTKVDSELRRNIAMLSVEIKAYLCPGMLKTDRVSRGGCLWLDNPVRRANPVSLNRQGRVKG
jgi:hypothetical protein